MKAKVYVIAANAIETPRLLLMSRTGGMGNGVANSSGLVGRHLMDHPYYVSWGLLPPNADPVYPYRGPLITSGIGDLCDGPFRTERAAFRVDIGNEGWNFVVAGGQFGADPNVTALDFVNGTNASGLNTASVSGLTADNQALFGVDLARKLNGLITRQFRIGFLVEQNPDPNNRVTLSPEHRDALLARPPQSLSRGKQHFPHRRHRQSDAHTRCAVHEDGGRNRQTVRIRNWMQHIFRNEGRALLRRARCTVIALLAAGALRKARCRRVQPAIVRLPRKTMSRTHHPTESSTSARSRNCCSTIISATTISMSRRYSTRRVPSSSRTPPDGKNPRWCSTSTRRR